MLKPKKGFVQEQLNIEKLSPVQWDGMKVFKLFEKREELIERLAYYNNPPMFNTRNYELHKTNGSYTDGYGCQTKFNVWRVYLDEIHHYAKVTFRTEKPYRSSKHTGVYDITLIEETTFYDASDYELLEKDIEVILERQKRLYPEAHKEQKSGEIKNINYKIKNYPHIVAKTKVAERITKWLPILRKRK